MDEQQVASMFTYAINQSMPQSKTLVVQKKMGREGKGMDARRR